MKAEKKKTPRETWDMRVLPRHDVAALQIDVFTKESGIHKEQTRLRNANIELPYEGNRLKVPEEEWEERVADCFHPV